MERIIMIGQQAYLYNKNNKLIDAAITATIAASARTPLVYPVTKQGTGNIAITGAYEGALDSKYEVIIADTSFTAPVVSSPVFRGAGTGKIKDVAVAGLAAQKITLTCMSTGVSTQDATCEIEGVQFKAKAAGAAGNAITISIDNSELVFTLQTYSTLKDLKEGDTALTGQEWDFDTKVILGDIIPATAHRIAFGDDHLHIYRQYKKFVDGKYEYYFIQPIKYPVAKGSKVYFVTEGRTVTVTDGVTEEVYEDIVTIADFWTAVQALPSALIEPVNGSIDTSMTPDSPAVRELAVMTDAYALPAYAGDNSSEYAGVVESVVVSELTKTELVSIECVDNTFIGEELWTVKGSSSGDLGQVKTGDFNGLGPVGFAIPQRFPKDWETKLKEDWSFFPTYMDRPEEVDPPPICLAFKQGAKSIAQTLQLEYTKKPTACACPVVSFNDAYLGFQRTGGELGMAYTVPDLVFWTDAQIEQMKEEWVGTGWSDETQEGRGGSVTPAVYNSSLTAMNFASAVADYVNLFKTLAKRIMALPEDDTEDLEAMVTSYKALVATLEVDAMTSVQVSAAPTISAKYIAQVTYDADDYVTLVDAVLLYETTYGLKKNTVNLTGDVPYIQAEDEFYWKFVGGDKQYLSAFTGIPYYSVISVCGCGDTYIGTKEFALNISVPCGGTLLEGDRITIEIGSNSERTYQLGDITFLPTVAAADLEMAGGIDGDDTYTFGVKGTVITSFPDCLLDRDAPLPYKGTNAPAWQAGHSYSLTNYVKSVTFNGYRYECTTAGTSGGTAPTWPTTIGATVNDNGVIWTCRACELIFEITDGIVPFSVGDLFEFNIEGGHFKWRKDGGAWSSAISIAETATSIAEGLSVAFVFGVSPSFVVDDQWEILCVQENKSSNLTLPWEQAAKGTDTIVFAFGSEVAVNALVIDEHTLTGTVKFQASSVSNFSTLLHDETLTITDLICNLYSTPITAQYFRLYFTGAYEIGYLFLGEMMRLTSDADSIVPLKRYSMSRQGGKKPFSLYNYQSKGFNIQYNSFIAHADYLLLDEMIEYLKALNDMPFYLVPNINYPTDCMKGRIDTDNQEPGSDIDYNMPPEKRIYTLNLPIVSA